jgi:hypothetical protein
MVYRTQATQIAAPKSSWNELWKKLRELYYIAEKPRHAAVLENFRNNKESICRRMGVISDADVVRVTSKLRPKDG